MPRDLLEPSPSSRFSAAVTTRCRTGPTVVGLGLVEGYRCPTRRERSQCPVSFTQFSTVAVCVC